MFGIVIAYDKTTKKGIVWCEDQKDLAIIDVNRVMHSQARDLVPGDQFIFQENWCHGIRKVTRIDQFFPDSMGRFAPDPAALIGAACANATRTSLKEVG